MAGNDQAGNDKPPSPNRSALSADEAERVASQFTPMWDDPTLEAAAPAQEPAPPLVPAPAPPLVPAPAPPVAPVAREPAPPPVAPPSPLGASTRVETVPAAFLVQAAPVAVLPAPIVAAAPPPVVAGDPQLPDSKIEYAPPRPLPVAQKTMLGLAPVSVDVAAAGPTPPAAATPVGVPSAPPARPALQMVGEPSSPELEAEADDPTKMDTVPPRSRAAAGKKQGRGIVLGVMGVAVALILAMGVRKLMGPSESDTKAAEPARAEAVPAETVPPPKPATVPPPEVTATPVPAPPPEPEPPPPEPPPPPPEPVKAAPEPHKAARPAPPRPAHVATHAATPPRVERPHRAQPEPPTRSSPTGAKGGAIVRESPF